MNINYSNPPHLHTLKHWYVETPLGDVCGIKSKYLCVWLCENTLELWRVRCVLECFNQFACGLQILGHLAIVTITTTNLKYSQSKHNIFLFFSFIYRASLCCVVISTVFLLFICNCSTQRYVDVYICVSKIAAITYM